ncbi:hypothetical protein N7467_011165 [Penicillium canescens]|nr:hypothetical protein N7467_011165 [Penicillium canescens]
MSTQFLQRRSAQLVAALAPTAPEDPTPGTSFSGQDNLLKRILGFARTALRDAKNLSRSSTPVNKPNKRTTFSAFSFLTFFSLDPSFHLNLSALKAPSPTPNFLSFSTLFNPTLLVPCNMAQQTDPYDSAIWPAPPAFTSEWPKQSTAFAAIAADMTTEPNLRSRYYGSI